MPLLTTENFDETVKVLTASANPRDWTVWRFHVAIAYAGQDEPRYQCTGGFGIPVLWKPKPSLLSRVEVTGPDLQSLREECDRAWARGCDLVLAKGHAADAPSDPDFARLTQAGA